MICKQCGGKFQNPRPSRKRTFCIDSCKLEFMRQNPIGGSSLGRIPWNKGLRKETDSRVAQYALAISIKRKGRFTGKDNSFYGRKHSAKTRELIGSYHYVNGKNTAKGYYGRGFNKYLKEEIKKRDGYRCQECGCLESQMQLNVHHIDYDTTNHKKTNLITLCKRCNAKVNFNRDDWKAYFQGILEEMSSISVKKGGNLICL